MARRRRSGKFVNTNVAMDVGIAALGVRLIPALVNQIYPLNPTLYTAAGIGGTYFVGKFMKKPLVSDAAIGIGAVEIVAPYLESILGGITGGETPNVDPAMIGAVKVNPKLMPAMVDSLSDYQRITLNDAGFTNNPGGAMKYYDYQESYR